MSQSLVQNYLHLIFSAKNRKSFIKPPIEQELHSYPGGIFNKLECHSIIIGGYTDHSHIIQTIKKGNLNNMSITPGKHSRMNIELFCESIG